MKTSQMKARGHLAPLKKHHLEGRPIDLRIQTNSSIKRQLDK